MKTLSTKRLVLRDWCESDIGSSVHNEDAIRYLLKTKNNYAVVLKENNEIIGTIGLNEDADDNPDTRHVGIRLLESYRNRGLMSEALECVIHNASDITKELSYLCLTEDKRSQHIAEKFGFRYIKTFYKVQKNASEDELHPIC